MCYNYILFIYCNDKTDDINIGAKKWQAQVSYFCRYIRLNSKIVTNEEGKMNMKAQKIRTWDKKQRRGKLMVDEEKEAVFRYAFHFFSLLFLINAKW